MTPTLALVLAVAAAYLAAHVLFDWLARRFLVVSAAEYLVLGILLGPQVTGLFSGSLVESFAPVVTLALGWIGAIVGTQLELKRLITIPARSFRIGFAESAITFAVVTGLEFVALRWSLASTDEAALVAAVALGTMAVASSNVGIALVGRFLGSRGPMMEQLELSTTINAVVAIGIFGLMLCIHHPASSVPRPLTPTEWAVVSVAIGVVGGTLFHVFLGDTPDPDRLFVALVGGIVLVSGAAAYLRLSPLLGGMFFGAILVNTTTRPELFVEALTRVERPFYFVLLFVGGLAWQPSSYPWVAVVALFVFARAAAKIGASRLAARMNGALDELGPHWGRALLGQGRLALAIGLSVLQEDAAAFPNLVFTAAIASLLVTEFLSARLARSVITRRLVPDSARGAGEDATVAEEQDATWRGRDPGESHGGVHTPPARGH